MSIDLQLKPPGEDDSHWFKFQMLASRVQGNSEKAARLNRAITGKRDRYGDKADIANERGEAALLNQQVTADMLDVLTMCVVRLNGFDVDARNEGDKDEIRAALIDNLSKPDLEDYFTQLANASEEEVSKSGANGTGRRHARTIEGKGHSVPTLEAP
jgi:hypothetical protein